MSEKSVFVIERTERGITWYIGAKVKRKYAECGYGWHWTHILADAVHFAREADAESVWEIVKHRVGHGAFDSGAPAVTCHIFDTGGVK